MGHWELIFGFVRQSRIAWILHSYHDHRIQPEENDYLEHQLYEASKSERIRKNRKRSRLIFPLFALIACLYFLFQEDLILACYFFALGLLWYLLFPLLDKRRHVRHFRNFIRENYRESYGEKTQLEITPEYLYGSNTGREAKILTTEVREISEIASSIMIRLKGGQSFFLPKNKIENLEELKTYLKTLADTWHVKYTLEDDWKWS